MNKIVITGNVCHTPETRTTQSGKSVCSFDVAVNSKRGGETKTEYFRISAWNKLGEVCQQYAIKGKKVLVMGEVSARAYMGRDGEPRYSIEVLAQDVEFLSPREQASPYADPQIAQTEREQAQTAAQYQQGEALSGFEEIQDNDLPF